jgi:hypothetical protein
MLEHMWLLKNLLHSVQQQHRLSFQIATGKEECFCGDAKQVQPSRHLVKRNIGK